MQQTVNTNFKIAKLPQQDGIIDPTKIGFQRLDIRVDMHLFFAPFDLSKFDYEKSGKKIIGSSKRLAGLALVSSILRLDQIMLTTAHETAHAFGFVSEERDPVEGHCQYEDCIMNSTQRFTKNTLDRRAVEAIRNLRHLNRSSNIVGLKNRPQQFSFCSDCREDMHEHGAMRLEIVKALRARNGMPRPFTVQAKP